jgi:hypothetical protein
MKITLILLLATLTLSAERWNYIVMIEKGYHFKIECSNYGIQMEQMLNKDEFVVFEQPLCIDYSTWDNDCKHKPLK